MTIKVYVSGICGSQEVRKQQMRVLFILQSLPIDLKVIDITEPGRDEDLVFMQEEAKKHDKKTQLPPQIFNDNDYCGDYADFELANDDDEILKFLKLEEGPLKAETLSSHEDGITQNGINHHSDKEVSDTLEQDVSNANASDSNNVPNDEDTELINTETSSEVKDDDTEIDESNVESTEKEQEIINDTPPDDKQPEESAEEESEEEESE